MKMRLSSTVTILSLFHISAVVASNDGSAKSTGLRQRKALFDDSPPAVSGGMPAATNSKGNSGKKDDSSSGKKDTGSSGGDKGSSGGDKGNQGKGGGGNPKTGSSLTSYLSLSETQFFSGSPLTVSFRLMDDPSSNFNVTNIDNWSLGVYMRMANPQNGALAPITSLKPTLDPDDGSGYRLGSATFSTANVNLMEGRDPSWPTDPIEHGSGYDAWLLTEDGIGVLGPETFVVLETPAMSNAIAEQTKTKPNHGLVKYNHAATKKTNYGNSGKGGGKEGGKDGGKGSGKNEMILGTTSALSEADYSIVTDKTQYTPGDSVKVSYTLNTDAPDVENIGNWTIGIYMHMAHPQGGALAPIASMPLCGQADCGKMKPKDYNIGLVEFKEGASGLEGDWPLSHSDYGFGFDAWMLDQDGVGKAGPHMFNFTSSLELAYLW